MVTLNITYGYIFLDTVITIQASALSVVILVSLETFTKFLLDKIASKLSWVDVNMAQLGYFQIDDILVTCFKVTLKISDVQSDCYHV